MKRQNNFEVMRAAAALAVACLAATATALAPAETPTKVQPSTIGRRLTSVHYQGGYGSGSTYGQRNQNSWVGFLVGFALLFIAPMFLVMTELQGVKITRLLGRARASTLANISSAVVDPALDGFMVHTTGPLSIEEEASGAWADKETGVCFGS